VPLDTYNFIDKHTWERYYSPLSFLQPYQNRSQISINIAHHAKLRVLLFLVTWIDLNYIDSDECEQHTTIPRQILGSQPSFFATMSPAYASLSRPDSRLKIPSSRTSLSILITNRPAPNIHDDSVLLFPLPGGVL
jgi:hypothetical protein